MVYNKKGFTLIELTISVVILSMLIIGIALSLVKISDNFFDSNIKNVIFSDIKNFTYDSYLFHYNNAKILTGGLLLYGSGNGVFLGQFEDINNGYDYKLYLDTTKYNQVYFGYFIFKSNLLTQILNNSIDITSFKFNDGKIYKHLLLKDFSIESFNGGKVFQINMEVFKNYSQELNNISKSDIQILAKDYLKFNFNF